MLDARHGIQTEGNVMLDTLNIPTTDRVHYAPSGWLLLRRALPAREVGTEDVFLDAGAGKGRIVLQAALRYRFRRVIGVELTHSLYRIASDNITANRGRCLTTDVELVHADITDYTVPDDVTIVYMYNPFTGIVFDTFIRRLLESIDRNPRPIRIIYVNPVEETRLLETGRVRFVRSVWGRCTTRIYLMAPSCLMAPNLRADGSEMSLNGSGVTVSC